MKYLIFAVICLSATAVSRAQYREIPERDYTQLDQAQYEESALKKTSLRVINTAVSQYTANVSTTEILTVQSDRFISRRCPRFCNTLYRPVCAWHPCLGWKTFDNACEFSSHNYCCWPRYHFVYYGPCRLFCPSWCWGYASAITG